MNLLDVISTFGMCSIFFAIGCYLKELCIYLGDRNKFEFLQKALALISVVLIYFFSIPAIIVFYPLHILAQKGLEKSIREDERERAERLFQADTNYAVRTAVEEEHTRLVEIYEEEMQQRIDKVEEKLQERFTEKCLSCPYRNDKSPGE